MFTYICLYIYIYTCIYILRVEDVFTSPCEGTKRNIISSFAPDGNTMKEHVPPQIAYSGIPLFRYSGAGGSDSVQGYPPLNANSIIVTTVKSVCSCSNTTVATTRRSRSEWKPARFFLSAYSIGTINILIYIYIYINMYLFMCVYL